jgi:hypothetical protein
MMREQASGRRKPMMKRLFLAGFVTFFNLVCQAQAMTSQHITDPLDDASRDKLLHTLSSDTLHASYTWLDTLGATPKGTEDFQIHRQTSSFRNLFERECSFGMGYEEDIPPIILTIINFADFFPGPAFFDQPNILACFPVVIISNKPIQIIAHLINQPAFSSAMLMEE